MNTISELDRQNIWHPFTPLVDADRPFVITSAKGVSLFTDDGKEIIDAVSSWWVNIHGHAHPEIANALFNQATTLEHVIFAGFTHKPAVTLSEKLLSVLPDHFDKIFFSDNGSTAVEVAIKMAIQYWSNIGKPRKKIIAVDGAYHGDTFGSMSVGERSIFSAPFNEHLFESNFIDFPTEQNRHFLFEQFERLLKADAPAAFIYEPLIQGAAGMRMYSKDILDELISIAQKHNVICIADEVMTGFYRTGKMFASDHPGNKPDIITLSKGLTGGTMPLGVTACSERIVSAFNTNDFYKTFFHGHSFTGNPLSCAVANTSFDLLLTEKCQENIEMINRSHDMFISKMKQHPKVVSARHLGTICAIELSTPDGTSYDNKLRKKIYSHFLNKGILLRPLGNVIYVLPPYVITETQLLFIYGAIEEFIETI
ncbi:MAG TPA: adenosylmethionine--8-amino-7-oxononanoate transaminase [Chryseosolibacter sp.]|nr:adenosylmethionine--8-amino-7-oxononanoate transaminase [Chryseosolibacter sp.]